MERSGRGDAERRSCVAPMVLQRIGEDFPDRSEPTEEAAAAGGGQALIRDVAQVKQVGPAWGQELSPHSAYWRGPGSSGRACLGESVW